MRHFVRLLLFATLISYSHITFAQDVISGYKPKNQTEKLIIEKIKALPEMKAYLKINKNEEPDLLINPPDSTAEPASDAHNLFSFQVGISNLDMFRTSYWLYVNPKNLNVFYDDFFDESGSKLITLKQWRYWRHKAGLYSNHKWVNGKLVLVKIKNLRGKRA